MSSPIYQVGQADDVCYLAMELLEGEPLDRWLDRTGLCRSARCCGSAARSPWRLPAAHARGLVHRDIKPANIWLEGPARPREDPRLRPRPPAGCGRQPDQSGMVVGTPVYMAPEQARGEAVDGRTDLFSLGCVLYRVVTGRPPFEGNSALADCPPS